MATQALTRLIKLSVDASQATRSLNKISKNTAKATKSFATFGKAIKAATSLIGVGFAANFVKQVIDLNSALGKTADTVGLTAETFQEFQFASERAGVGAAQFSSNMTAFVKRVGEANVGMGPLVTGLKKLDSGLLDAITNAKDQSEAFKVLADGVKNAENATQRAAIVNAAFGRSGIAMVKVLEGGAAGLDEMAKTARELGIVIDDKLIRSAEEAADKIGDLKEVLQAKISVAILQNADAITELAESLIRLTQAATQVPGILGFVYDEFQALAGFIDNDDFIRLSDKLAGLEEDLKKMTAPGFVGALGRILTPNDAERIADTKEEIRAVSVLLDEIQARAIDRSLAEQFKEIEVTATRVTAVFSTLSEAVVTAQKQFVFGVSTLGDSFKDGIEYAAEFQKQIDTLAGALNGSTALAEYNADLKVLNAAWKSGAILMVEYQDEYIRLGEVLSGNKVKPPLEEINNLTADLSRAGISFIESFSSGLADSLVDGELNFKEFTEALLKDLAKMILRAVLLNSIMSAIGGTAAGNFLGVSSAGGGTPSVGGSRSVGTFAAPTPAPALKSTVGILQPASYGYSGGKSKAGSGTVINITNNAPVDVETKERRNSQGGIEIDVMIERQINRSIANGGLDRSMSGAYGLKRQAY